MPDTLQASPAIPRAALLPSCCIAALLFIALLLAFHQTTWSMISTWLRSDTYAHGFLVLPISLWLIWNYRDRLSGVQPVAAPWIAILIIPVGFAWLVASLVDVLVVQQLALVAMLILGTWAVLGHGLTRALVFPLLFLFFAVPMGEALVPPMMEFTASATVWLIQQTGIPVYREGMYFTLPSGSWSVVEACSGVRYIVASLTLGVLFAYLTFRSPWRRLLFVLASIIVPVIANAGRAFIIVMLGHFSDMKIATGPDHLIYGWLFFGVAMFFLFWLGSRFSEDSIVVNAGTYGSTPHQASGPWKSVFAGLLVLAVASIWPLLANKMQMDQVTSLQNVEIELPQGKGGWQNLQDMTWTWSPENSVSGQVAAYYEMGGQVLGFFVQYALEVPAENDVIGSSTRFTAYKGRTRLLGVEKVEVQLGDKFLFVDQAKLRNDDGELLAWSWYRVGGRYTSNDYMAKFLEAWSTLGFGPVTAYRLIVAVPMQDSVSSTRGLLQDFLDLHGDSIDSVIEQAQGGNP